MSEPRGFDYIVVCTHRDPEVAVRVVGTFDSQQAAVDWAHAQRAERPDWTCRPDILQDPTGLYR